MQHPPADSSPSQLDPSSQPLARPQGGSLELFAVEDINPHSRTAPLQLLQLDGDEITTVVPLKREPYLLLGCLSGKGPAHAVAQALRRLGWCARNAMEWRTGLGVLLHLKQACPGWKLASDRYGLRHLGVGGFLEPLLQLL